MSGLYFDTEIYKKDTSVYSSLEDLNGYQVFSDEFYETMMLMKAEEQAELEGNYKIIFTNDVSDTLNETYMYVMNSTQPLVIRNDFEQDVSGRDYSSIAFVAAGMLLTTTFIMVVTMIKNMRKNR